MGEKRLRKSSTNQLKAKVAREAIKGQRTISEIASDYHRQSDSAQPLSERLNFVAALQLKTGDFLS